MLPRSSFRNALGLLMSSVSCSVALALVSMAPAAQAQVVPNAPADRPAHPYTPKHLYSETADPAADIAGALKQARQEHKRVILDFGGDWCGDCQVLDIYFHQAPNLEILDKNFLVVHVDIGHLDKNLDIPEKYNLPLSKGVPALAVLDANGKLLYSQQAAEFGDVRYMYPSSVTDFLNKWKA